MIDLIFIPLLAAHLLCVNVAAAGPLIAIWLEWKASRGDGLAGQTAGDLGWASLVTLVAGGLLGLAMGALRWDKDYAELWLNAMRSKAFWGIAEYAFSLLLASMYLALRSRAGPRQRGIRYLILLLNGTNLLYHFPFLFSVATTVEYSEHTAATLTAGDFRQWMMKPEVLAKAIHVILASFAVTGVLLMGLALRLLKLQPLEGYERVTRWGAWIALIPSLAQIPSGLWLIVALPPAWQARTLGGDVASTVMLATSVLLALWMLQDLATIALGQVQRRHVVRSMMLMTAVVLLMSGVLERIKPITRLKDSSESFDSQPLLTR